MRVRKPNGKKAEKNKVDFDRDYLGDFNGLIGVDEAGRGCLAGPVIAGAVFISKDLYFNDAFCEAFSFVNDSKQLSEAKREVCFELIEQWASDGSIRFAYGAGDIAEIEKHNILGANRLAMRRAVDAISENPGEEKILVDGLALKPFPYKHTPIVKGDGKSLAIACASIVAKVSRDRLMHALDKEFPGYGLAEHKGYATEQHRTAILKLGPSVCHREKFLRKLLEQPKQLDLF